MHFLPPSKEKLEVCSIWPTGEGGKKKKREGEREKERERERGKDLFEDLEISDQAFSAKGENKCGKVKATFVVLLFFLGSSPLPPPPPPALPSLLPLQVSSFLL